MDHDDTTSYKEHLLPPNADGGISREVSINGMRSSQRRSQHSRNPSVVSHRFEDLNESVKAGYKFLGCHISGNALSLLTAAFLFALITAVQYIYALKANSIALQADCVSMAVDSLAFLGNLFAECAPNDDNKRRIQLVMSGISHFLLLGFTVYFIFDAINTLRSDEEDDVSWVIVFIFALMGLTFDTITLIVYTCFGERKTQPKEREDSIINDLEHSAHSGPYLPDEPDALTCGINTNMCAALLHVIADLGRSATTLVESLILHFIPSIPGNKADGVAALIICGVIVVGSFSAVLVWMREVWVYITTPLAPEDPYFDEPQKPLVISHDNAD